MAWNRMSTLAKPTEWTPDRPLSNVMSPVIPARREGLQGLASSKNDPFVPKRSMADRNAWESTTVAESDHLMVRRKHTVRINDC